MKAYRRIVDYYTATAAGDPGFAGVLTRNPMSWADRHTKTIWNRREPYPLAEAAEVIPLHWRRPQQLETGVGDLTAGFDIEPGIEERLSAELGGAFRAAAASLGYVGVALEVNCIEKRPKDLFATARAPALKIKIIHTVKTPQGRTQEFYFDIDLSFNEPVGEVEILGLEDGRHFYAYALVDLIAEKYRAILQQVSRRRERHQDVYDLHYLTADNDIDDAGKRQILDVMMEKSRARTIEPTKDALDDPEIRRRSEARWGSLDLEIGSAPAFSTCFDQVRTFYESLPWESA